MGMWQVVAAPEEYSWASIRAELASLYQQAGMDAYATFVGAASEG